MSVEFDRIYQYGSGVYVRYEHLNDEPAVVIQRNRRAYKIGLSKAYAYADDGYLVKQGVDIADFLGLGGAKNTVYQMCDIVHNHLDELVKLPPDKMQTKTDFENELDRMVEKHGMKLMVDGENILQ